MAKKNTKKTKKRLSSAEISQRKKAREISEQVSEKRDMRYP